MIPIEQCPCETCISLAICYQKDVIECIDLYMYLCNVDGDVPKASSFVGHKIGRGIPILTLYNRYIEKTNIARYSITFTKHSERRMGSLYRSRNYDY